jgi:carbamoylphosphate synthase small subunit
MVFLVATNAHIGNYGVNYEEVESNHGVILGSFPIILCASFSRFLSCHFVPNMPPSVS